MKRRTNRLAAEDAGRATRVLRQAVLSTIGGPAWLAIAGAWSVALAAPYLGPLFGLPPGPGEWVEIAVHLSLGLFLLAGAVAADRLGAQEDATGVRRRYRWLLLAAGLVLVSGHWFSMPALDGGHPTWTRLTAHLMPGLMALAASAAALYKRAPSHPLLERGPEGERKSSSD